MEWIPTSVTTSMWSPWRQRAKRAAKAGVISNVLILLSFERLFCLKLYHWDPAAKIFTGWIPTLSPREIATRHRRESTSLSTSIKLRGSGKLRGASRWLYFLSHKLSFERWD